MLSCENITCQRHETTVFAGLGFCLKEGTLLIIKGPNGSGKSSLLDILSGRIDPETGEVFWNDRPLKNNTEFLQDMMSIGHKNDVDENLTPLENITGWAKIYGNESLTNAALHFYDLEPFQNRKLVELSVGVQRRVALARLIVAPCKLWLLDEPTNFLDDSSLMLTTSLIETRVKQGGIVIVASHIMGSSVPAHSLNMLDFSPTPNLKM